jgi:hypothetical protein
MNPFYPSVALRAGHRCEYCRAPVAIFNFPFEVEHIIPTGRAGSDDDSDLALACRACNRFKSNLLEGLDGVTGEVIELFHPRRDRWDEHFRFEPESGAVLGLTPTGRATAVTLKMNRSVQLAARRQWIELGLFP